MWRTVPVLIVSSLVMSVASESPRDPVVMWYFQRDSLTLLNNIDWKRTTHLMYAEKKPQLDCSLGKLISSTGEDLDEVEVPIVLQKCRENGIKMIAMIGGWGGCNYFGNCARDENRPTLVKSLVDYVKKTDIDGVDIDWEHPGIGGACDYEKWWAGTTGSACWMDRSEFAPLVEQGWVYNDPDDWTNYLQLLKDLRSAFNLLEEEKGRHIYLTSAVGVGGHADGCQGRTEGTFYTNDPEKFHYVPCTYPDWTAICQEVDYLSPMWYDLWGDYFSTTGHASPLACDPEDPIASILSTPFTNPCEPRFTVKTGVEWYVNPEEPAGGHVYSGGCPVEKLLLGMPVYGKSACETDGLYKSFDNSKCTDVVNEVKNAAFSALFTNTYYLTRQDMFFNHTNKDGELVGTYFYDAENKHFMTIDTPSMFFEKGKYAATRGMGGYFYWVHTQDYEHIANQMAYDGWYEGKGLPVPDPDDPSVAHTVCVPSLSSLIGVYVILLLFSLN